MFGSLCHLYYKTLSTKESLSIALKVVFLNFIGFQNGNKNVFHSIRNLALEVLLKEIVETLFMYPWFGRSPYCL